MARPEGQTYALWHRSEALTALGRADAGLACAEEALAIAQGIGHRGWTATASLAVGLAQHAAGDLGRAESALRDSLETSRHLPLFTCWAAARGDPDAGSIARGALAVAEEGGHLVSASRLTALAAPSS